MLTRYTNVGRFNCEPPPSIVDSKDEGIPMGVCVCGHKLKVHMMRERHAAMTTTITTGMMSTTSKKWTIYMHVGLVVVQLGKKDVADAMCKYYNDNVEEADDGNEEVEEEAGQEDNKERNDDVDRFEVLFKSFLLLPPLCLDAWQCYGLMFSLSLSRSLSQPSPILSLLILRLLMPTLLESESLYALSSPTMSYSSS